MSKLSDDITGAILRMTSDLNEFNRTFRNNTEELRTTLSTVNSNYSDQIKLIDRINNLNIGQIAQANIDVYTRLQGCTEVLGRLFEIISNSVGATSLISCVVTQIIFKDNYFPIVDTYVFKDSHVRFLTKQYSSTSTCYIYDTNHINQINERVSCCLSAT